MKLEELGKLQILTYTVYKSSTLMQDYAVN